MEAANKNNCDIEDIDNFIRHEGSEDDEIEKDVEIEKEASNPTITEKVEEPKIGQPFSTADEMFSYYTSYARQKGFPVLRRSSKKGSSGELKYVTFTCARAGKFTSKSANRLKPRPSTKTGCGARIAGCLDDDGKWRISSLDLEHNHPVSPGKARFLRCFRKISASVKRRLEINDATGVRLNKNFNTFVIEAGGHENVPFLEKDCRNYIGKMRRLQLAEGDAAALQNYFLKMQSENSDFYFSIDLDKKGRLKNVFWADSRSRAAYKEYGQVITFDTTYLTNKYDMPFAPFVGVNHHGQSILLGCALISCEDTETFTWLFQTWLVCMSGRAPSGIITDQDKAMKKAIEVVFPNARHRWCLWHIMKNFHEKLGSYKHYEQITFYLQGAIYDSQSREEFEENWMMITEKYSLTENEWLNGLFGERNRWVPCFVKDGFWAGMSTTQRSESINAFFDGFVNHRTCLKQFVEQYSNALASKVQKENEEDSNSTYKQVPCVTKYVEMERQAQQVYTISKFQEFQEELTGKMYCDFLSTKENGTDLVYDIGEDVLIGERMKRVTFNVLFNKYECEVKCSCKRFEFRGILCRHALTVLIRNNVGRIPEKYILRIWRKDVKRCHTKVKICYSGRSASTEQSRLDKISNIFDELVDIAVDDEKDCDYVFNLLSDAKKNLEEKKKASRPLDLNSEVSTPSAPNILDPAMVKKKVARHLKEKR